jgi:hypothetical protein
LVTISPGVPLGAAKTYYTVLSRPATPAAVKAGTSGSDGDRHHSGFECWD